jgi:hypothetical protein
MVQIQICPRSAGLPTRREGELGRAAAGPCPPKLPDAGRARRSARAFVANPEPPIFKKGWQASFVPSLNSRTHANPVPPHSQDAGTTSPSPGGEGWGEGGLLNTNILFGSWKGRASSTPSKEFVGCWMFPGSFTHTLHPAPAPRPPSLVIRHSSFVIRHSSFVIRHRLVHAMLASAARGH